MQDKMNMAVQKTLFEIPMKGRILFPQPKQPFYPIYKSGTNVLYEGNSIECLKTLENESIDLIFADPPY